MSQIKLKLPDGQFLDVKKGNTVLDVAEQIGSGLAKVAIAGKVDGVLTDLRTPLLQDADFEVVTKKSDEALEVYRHSMAHIMAYAVQKKYPDAKFGIGPSIENGFYYDFDLPAKITADDFEEIESSMQEIIKANLPFERKELTKEEALDFFEKKGQKYKVELIRELEDQPITIFRLGDFVDLCRGPHMKSSGEISAFKLLSVAGSYWRGDEKREMLQRVYGTSFRTPKELKAHLDMLEEAKKRDHRKLSKELGLFSTHEEIGPGLIIWHPNASRIRHVIEAYWKEQHYKHGYELLYTPHIGQSVLWETSGHLNYYQDSMYSPIDIDGANYYLKPMNCPFHIMAYKSELRSYRDLPLRWAELGTVYRYEKSGVLHGTMRVRGFTQDDAHIFCTPEQMDGEIREILRFSLSLWRAFGFSEIKAYLATKPAKAAGKDNEKWEQATEALKNAIIAEGLDWEVDEGGGAFYGPKIDLKIRDALGREWQMTTVQFDWNLTERFDMTYIGADGEKHRPYMIHRALLGSLERFFGVLTEHYAGAFPPWLAPVQAVVLPIADVHIPYAEKVLAKLRNAGIRASIDTSDDKIGYRIRQAQLKKIPFMIILGAEEAEEDKVTVRYRNGENKKMLDLNEFIDSVEWRKADI